MYIKLFLFKKKEVFIIAAHFSKENKATTKIDKLSFKW